MGDPMRDPTCNYDAHFDGSQLSSYVTTHGRCRCTYRRMAAVIVRTNGEMHGEEHTHGAINS
jgi:hypothetical protein